MEILLWFLFLLGYNFPAFHAYHSSPNVVIPLGTIKGSILETVKGRKIYSFRGIRYAKAPINELRFKVMLNNNIKVRLGTKIETSKILRMIKIFKAPMLLK